MADLVGGQEPLVRVREARGGAPETVLCRDAQRTRGQTDGTAVKEGGVQKQFPRNPGRAAPEVAASSEIKEAQPLTPRLIDR